MVQYYNGNKRKIPLPPWWNSEVIRPLHDRVSVKYKDKRRFSSPPSFKGRRWGKCNFLFVSFTNFNEEWMAHERWYYTSIDTFHVCFVATGAEKKRNEGKFPSFAFCSSSLFYFSTTQVNINSRWWRECNGVDFISSSEFPFLERVIRKGNLQFVLRKLLPNMRNHTNKLMMTSDMCFRFDQHLSRVIWSLWRRETGGVREIPSLSPHFPLPCFVA